MFQSLHRLHRWIVLQKYSLSAHAQHPIERVRLALLRRRRVSVRFSIGDSHADGNFAGIPNVVPLHLGPITMHRIARDGLESFLLFRGGLTLWPRSLLLQGDEVFFCFGEIDCRCHIAQQIAAGRREEEVINTLAEGYVTALRRARQDDIAFWIVSVTPPAFADSLRGSRLFAPAGSDADRARYTLSLNRALRTRATQHGFRYLDIHTPYADAQGMLIPSLSDGTVHIGDTTKVRELLGRLSAPNSR